MKKVIIGSDHGGFELKNIIVGYIQSLGGDIEDIGTYTVDSVDYPDYAKLVCEKVLIDRDSLGILVCGTGIGMSITANKMKGSELDSCIMNMKPKCASNTIIAIYCVFDEES